MAEYVGADIESEEQEESLPPSKFVTERSQMGGEMVETGTTRWKTLKRGELRIPTLLPCPPPPRKKKPSPVICKSHCPKDGYFCPPDLELLFSLAPKRSGKAMD